LHPSSNLYKLAAIQLEHRDKVSRAALQITRSQVNRWFLVQLLAIIIATLIFFLSQNVQFAQSVCLGGFLCLLPQWVFARLWLAYYKASSAPKIIRMFYVGEVLKLLLTAALFIAALHTLPINPIACLIGFMIAQVSFWVAPLLCSKKILIES
jgi:ATP synthase protein I